MSNFIVDNGFRETLIIDDIEHVIGMSGFPPRIIGSIRKQTRNTPGKGSKIQTLEGNTYMIIKEESRFNSSFITWELRPVGKSVVQLNGRKKERPSKNKS